MNQRITDLIKGLAASATIVVLLFGVPLLLIGVIGMPVAELVSDLTDPLVSEPTKAAAAMRLGLSLIVWLAWLQVTWSLLLELAAAARGIGAASSRVVPTAVQRWSRHLVAASMLLLTVFSSPVAASGLTALSAPVVETVDGVSFDADWLAVSSAGSADELTAVDTGGGRRAESGAAAAALTDHAVQPDDTFWSVAESTLGDGFRWREIRDANVGRVMPDGSTITDATESLLPGWVLLVPRSPAAPTATALPADVETGLETTTVNAGDHFWELARRKLADSWSREPTDKELTSYWAEMVDLNDERLLPPGNPDLIYPGQEVLYPTVPDVSGVDGPAPTVPSHGRTETTGGLMPEPAVSADPAVVDREPEPDESNATGTFETRDPSSIDADTDADDPAFDPPVGLVAASGIGLLTAAVGAIIARSQAHRIGVRRPGSVPRFLMPGSAEKLIATTSDERALDDLDRSLRYLGVRLSADDLAMPDLVGVLINQKSIRLLVATPHNSAPEPFTVERGGMVWSIARPVPDLDVCGALNPYPTLVSVGYTASAQLLIDVEYVGSLNLVGGFADVVDEMSTMALQLATSPMADTIEVICVGFGEELSDFERITVVPSIDTVRSIIGRHADGAATLAEATGNTGPGGRADSVGDWTPMVVFDPLSELDGDSSELLDAAGRSSASGVSAVMTAVDSAELTMELSEAGVAIPSYRVSLSRRPLTRAERTGLTAAVAVAKEPGHSTHRDLLSTIGSSNAGNEPSPQPDNKADTASSNNGPRGPIDHRYPVDHRYIVRLLGPLRVEDAEGASVQFARSATPEFLAYLAHHRNGAEVGQVMNTLWPATTAKRTWIANVNADAARTLAAGLDHGVTLTSRPGADDEYCLAAEVTSDLEQFRTIVTRAVDRPVDDAVGLLTDALALIEGLPYSGITSRWPVAEGHWQDATVMVDEAARCVAAVALDQLDDPALAEWATARGLLASPHSVELHRLRLRAAIALDGGGHSSNPTLSPDAVFQHYQAVVMADDHRPEAASRLDSELVELYESYVRMRPRPPSPMRAADGDTMERRRQR